jgi:hypothetical protein
MELRSSENIPENTGRRIRDVRLLLLALRDARNNPIPELQEFKQEDRKKAELFLRKLIDSGLESQDILFDYEYLYTLNFDINQKESMHPPEHALTGRKSIRA